MEIGALEINGSTQWIFCHTDHVNKIVPWPRWCKIHQLLPFVVKYMLCKVTTAGYEGYVGSALEILVKGEG